MLGGGFDFAAIFAQLRRNEVELQLGVDLFFGRAGHAPLAFQRGQGVFVERVAHLSGAAAQRDVVLLRAGEVDQRGAVVFRQQQAHVHLHALGHAKAHFIFAARQHLLDFAVAQNVLRERFELARRWFPARR